VKEIDYMIEHFQSYVKVSPELRSALIDSLNLISFSKGELVLDASQVCTESYFINEGIMRTYFIKDDRKISEYFSSVNEWVNSPKSFIHQETDVYHIDAIEDVSAFSLNVKDLTYLFDHFPEMEKYARLSMGHVYGHLMDRIVSLRFSTAKEKLDYFQKVYSNIYPRIPLGMVASYLGITQETLSRIRAQK